MAESSQILLDVKLDLKDGKCELYYFKSWVKCFVKIEAIQCFPCYLKISFYDNDDNIKGDPLAIIRINIPGVRVETAASRTKALAYGVFWKNNRKRCKLFFAFTEKAKYMEHMCWLKKAIDSLEDYRKEILENHRMSRSVMENQTDDDKITCNGPSDGEKKSHKRLTAQTRDLNDVLGPLPAIPSPSMDNSSRWSMRRASGCSGIYEEILDPANSDSQSETSRKSVASGIYVDMTTPMQRTGSENSETPPPLPPRRRFAQNAYADIAVYAAKSKKSTWNLMNVFGRSKMATDTVTSSTNSNDNLVHKRGNVDAIAPYTKNRNISIIAKSRSENLNIDLLASKHNSFSTPDLTNIVDASQQQSNDNADDADLDIMDIERSNSLNCSANQFLSRPPTLNISSNILWSHNLSSTLSSNCDSSAINLVGANVNSNTLLREDLSGYCQMAPIIRNKSPPLTEPKSPAKIYPVNGLDTVDACCANRLIENASGYCQMAPIINHTNATKSTGKADLTKNITFDRKYDRDEDSFSLLEFSLLSNDKHSSHRGSNEENSSSGVSSDEGIIYTTTTSLSSTALNDSQLNCMTEDIENDDAVSITCTESPNSSSPLNNTLPFHTTKFDEKYPSYFPNTSCSSSPTFSSSSRQSGNSREESLTRKPLYERQKSKCIEPTSQSTESPPSTPHISYKKTNSETVIKSTPAKVQKTKQRKGSTHSIVGIPITAIVPGDENLCSYHRKEKNHKNSENCKFKINQTNNKNPKHKPANETKNVLKNADGNAKSHSFDKNGKTPKQSSSSSPRRIYNKCATLATRLKTPPTTPTEAKADTFDFNYSRSGDCITLPPITKSFSFDVVDGTNSTESNNANKDGIGLLRFASLSRFRKFDFSPLKHRINNILQRPNIEI